MLWFDVESRYEATNRYVLMSVEWLWFDVESRYEATTHIARKTVSSLWFDVESRYEATRGNGAVWWLCCGLM